MNQAINEKAVRSYKSRVNNAQGQIIEKEIERACLYYKVEGVAEIEKTPEPFSVTEKKEKGCFIGRFGGKKAQPDFKGTLLGGLSIVFEVKSTKENAIKESALTKNQSELLERHYKLGAIAFVCVVIGQRYFTIPWSKWRDMKKIYGRKHIKAEEITEFEVKYSHGIMFLDALKKIQLYSRKAEG